MKCTKTLLPALLVSVMATTAQAGDGGISLFRCGLQVGGESRVYTADSASRKNQQFRDAKRFKSMDSYGPAVATFTNVKVNDSTSRRLPRIFTLARVGCSWR